MMSKRSKLNIKANNVIKNTINGILKNISIVAVLISIGVITLLYFGPEISLATEIVFKLMVPSVVLAISVILIYELWLTNGKNTAREEEDYLAILNTYDIKSDKLHYPTAQMFLDYEYQRRYKVEQDRLTRLLDRELSILDKLKSTGKPRVLLSRLWWDLRVTKRNIRKLTSAINRIRVTIPFDKSEEFDYLRYAVEDIMYKEYTPQDSSKHLAKARVKKYIKTITTTLIGFNLLSIGSSVGDDLWTAIIMTALAMTSIFFAIIGGFDTGYKNVFVISAGIYKTAISFLDQAVAWSKREGKDLYYVGVTEFKQLPSKSSYEPPKVEFVNLGDEVLISEEIFTEAAKSVTNIV